MQPSSTKRAIGVAIFFAAVAMLTNLWYVLLVVGIFMFLWGHKPVLVYNIIKMMPGGASLSRWLKKADEWVEGAAGTYYDPAVIIELQNLFNEGNELRRTGPGFTVNTRDIDLVWERNVLAYLQQHIQEEAFSFEHCHDHKVGVERMDVKLIKLRMIIQRQETQQRKIT